MELYHHDGQGNIYDMDGDGTITVADTIEESRKRDRESDDEDTGGTGGQPPTDGGSQSTNPTQPPMSQPSQPVDDPVSTPTPVQVAIATLEDIVFLFNPMVEQLIQDAFETHNGDKFRALQAFHANAQQAWNTIPANMHANGSNLYAWESAIEILNTAGHAVQFAAGAVRRDLAFDGYHDQTGIRIWTHSRYDDLYAYPSLGSNTEVVLHVAAITALRVTLKQRVDDGNLITNSYQDKLDYLVGLKSQFDTDLQLSEERYDDSRTQVDLDYNRVHIEYSSYLLVATNYHIGTFETWRPVAMSDIITIPPGFGLAPYTRTLERMVHYKLGTPQFMDAEQILGSSWRLVRQLPAGSTTWHPKNDNLEGVDTMYGGNSYYGVIDRTDWTWSVPFNKPRPAHAGQIGYSMPDEMLIANADFSKWVYFPRSSHVLGPTPSTTSSLRNVYATNLNSSPHQVDFWVRSADAVDPVIANASFVWGEGANIHIIYAENAITTFNPQKGSHFRAAAGRSKVQSSSKIHLHA